MEEKQEIGGDRRKPGPLTDRVMMRLKDAIIIGTAAVALMKWFILNPIQVQERVSRQEVLLTKQQETLVKIAGSLEVQISKLEDIEKRFREFQRSFYSKQPGGWTYEDDKWRWSGKETGKN